MNNMGGLVRLYIVDAEYYDHIDLQSEFLYNLIFGSGWEMERVNFKEDTGRISQTEDESDNGTVYNIEVSFRIANIKPSNADPLNGLGKKKVIIIAYDSNDYIWLVGQPGSYFNVRVISDTGSAAQELNSRTVNLSATLDKPAVFINTIT